MGVRAFVYNSLMFYNKYHAHPVNKLIHFLCVPLLSFTIMIILARTPPLYSPPAETLQRVGEEVSDALRIPLSYLATKIPDMPTDVPPEVFEKALYINSGFIVAFIYSFFYTIWDPIAGISWTICMAIPQYLLANIIDNEVPGAWRLALALHVFSWYMQLHPGHMIFEKKKPALLDGFIQAFLTAPLFVWLDFMFVFGYRPKLQAEIKNRVEEFKED